MSSDTMAHAFFESLVPGICPKPWIILNTVCLLSSTFIFYDILYTEGPLERRYGTQLYISWNFGTTIVWVLQTALTYWYFNYDHSNTPDITNENEDDKATTSWINRIQLVAAVYFLMDSLHMLYRWRKTNKHVEAEEWDVGISTVAYLFELMVVLRAYYKRGDFEPVQTALLY